MSKKAKILAAADKYISQQKYEKALNELLNVVKLTPSDTNLLNKVGDLYAKTNNNKSAISYFERVAQSYHRSGFYPKAIAVYKKINRLDDGYMDAREKLVELYLQQGHLSEAKAELKRMAEVYTANNLPGRALDVFYKLVEIDPNNIDIRIKLTELLIREGKSEEASEHFLSMGHDLIEKNMVNEARKILGQASKFAPDNHKIQILMAKATIAEGKMDEAIKSLTDICEKAPHDLEAVVTLGEAYLSKGMPKYAKTCYLRAIHIQEDHIQPLEDVAKLFIENGELDEAYEALEPVCDFMMGRNEHEEATRLFRSILYADENHARSLLKLVEIYRKSNQISNAILTYEKLINSAMANNDKARAQSYIADLLELDPDNLEWRTKMDSLSGITSEDALGLSSESVAELSASLSAASLSSIEDSGEAEILSIEAPDHGPLEPDDPMTVIQNHLTEADVFIKYGIMDQALTHLLAIIDLDPKHVEANQRLKQIYLDRDEVDKGVACLTNLANIYMANGQLGEAEECLNEAEQHKPGVARMYRGKLESLRAVEMQEHLEDQSQRGFDVELAGDLGSSGDLVLNEVAPEDVVDFGALADNANDGDQDADWSLDMANDKNMPGFAFDVSNEVSDEMLGQEIQVDAGDDSMRFFEQVDETEMLDEPDESSFSVSSLEDLDANIELDENFGANLDDDLGDVGQIELEDDGVDLAAEFRAEFGLGDADEDLDAGVDSLAEVDADDDRISVDVGHVQLDEVGSAEDGGLSIEMIDDEDPADSASIEIEPEDSEMAEPEVLKVEEEEVSAPDIPSTVDLEEEPVEAAAQTELSEQDRSALDNELEEIDFFLSMEAYDDAINLVEEAAQRFGEHPDIIERRETIAKMQAKEAPASAPSTPGNANVGGLLGDGGFFDLAAELKDELFEESSEVTDNAQPEEIQSVEELFEEFKKGVAEQIDEDDFETHYDLGIAYKEMGLLDESMSEFQKALGDKKRNTECTAMIGACLVELGRSEDAVAHYQTALKDQITKKQDRLAIKYELALVFEGLGEIDDALNLFKEIQAENPGYRDTQAHIEALV